MKITNSQTFAQKKLQQAWDKMNTTRTNEVEQEYQFWASLWIRCVHKRWKDQKNNAAPMGGIVQR